MFERAHTYQTLPMLRRLMHQYILQHRNLLILAIVCMVVVAAATAANAWIMKPALDGIFERKDVSMLRIVPIVVFIIAIISGAANYGQTAIMRNVGQRIVADMQMDLFAHLMHADLAVYHDQAAGRLISRFTNDIMMMRGAVSNVLTGIAKDFFTMVFLVALMFEQSVTLALIAFVVFPLAVMPIIRLGRRMRKISNATQDQLGVFAAQLDETFNGVRMVKAYGREEHEIARARHVTEKLYMLYFKGSRVQALAGPIMELLTGGAIACVIWYGGYHVINGEMTTGGFVSFIAAMLLAYKPAKTLSTLNNSLQEGMAAAGRLFAILDTHPVIHDRPGAKALVVTRGAARFEDASFHYTMDGGGIENITIDIPAGKTVALVGPSGSGKSTMINLLLRFYDVNRGMITIDGQDIREVTIASLRGSMALVSQEIVLFDDTVRANIAYSRMDATDAEIIEAARMADADGFIRELPQGYDTPIGPHGVKLSGGQRQRLAIARAILKNAPILLLDEATSSLDNTSERLVQLALENLMQGRTTLVVAHRLSTIRNADIIYVLDRGRIVEAGPHAMLLAKEGAYATLYKQAEAHGAIVQ